MKPIVYEIGPRAHGALVSELIATREGPNTTAHLLKERIRVGILRATATPVPRSGEMTHV